MKQYVYTTLSSTCYLNVYLTSFSHTASRMSFAVFNATKSDATLEKNKKASWQKAIGKCHQIQLLVLLLLVVQAAPRLEARRGNVLIVARSAISRPTKSVLLVLHKILSHQHLHTRTPDSLSTNTTYTIFLFSPTFNIPFLPIFIFTQQKKHQDILPLTCPQPAT